jgi:hypothetical protein
VSVTGPLAADGSFTVDFGQNAAAVVRITVGAPGLLAVGGGGGAAGGGGGGIANVTILHGESVMHPPYGPMDGSVYTGNLRKAEARDVIILEVNTTSAQTSAAAAAAAAAGGAGGRGGVGGTWSARRGRRSGVGAIDAEGWWEPTFTQHGFRYAQLFGLARAPTADEVEAVELRSAVRTTGRCARGQRQQREGGV